MCYNLCLSLFSWIGVAAEILMIVSSSNWMKKDSRL
jgi:hypothetical protein